MLQFVGSTEPATQNAPAGQATHDFSSFRLDVSEYVPAALPRWNEHDWNMLTLRWGWFELPSHTRAKERQRLPDNSVQLSNPDTMWVVAEVVAMAVVGKGVVLEATVAVAMAVVGSVLAMGALVALKVAVGMDMVATMADALVAMEASGVPMQGIAQLCSSDTTWVTEGAVAMAVAGKEVVLEVTAAVEMEVVGLVVAVVQVASMVAMAEMSLMMTGTCAIYTHPHIRRPAVVIRAALVDVGLCLTLHRSQRSATHNLLQCLQAADESMIGMHVHNLA